MKSIESCARNNVTIQIQLSWLQPALRTHHHEPPSVFSFHQFQTSEAPKYYT